MHVLVDRNGQVQLVEPNDFQSFKLVVEQTAASLPQVRAQLTGISDRIDEIHAWISSAWLRRDGATLRPDAWQEKFRAYLSMPARRAGSIQRPAMCARMSNGSLPEPIGCPTHTRRSASSCVATRACDAALSG